MHDPALQLEEKGLGISIEMQTVLDGRKPEC